MIDDKEYGDTDCDGGAAVLFGIVSAVAAIVALAWAICRWLP